MLLKEFVGDNEDELYQQERAMAIKEAEEKDNMRKQAIPGLVKQEAFERGNGERGFDEEEYDDL